MDENSPIKVDNTVVYELYLPDKEEEKLELYTNYFTEHFGHIQWKSGDGFKLELMKQPDNESSYLIVGRTKFDTNIEDEWLAIYILYNLTKLDPDLVIRVFDDDGNILLIEAAEHLPKWLNTSESDQRAFIYRNHLHIIPNDVKLVELETFDGKLTQTQAAANYVRNHCKSRKRNRLETKTLANSSIQTAIKSQLRGLPDTQAWLDKKLKFLDKVISDKDRYQQDRCEEEESDDSNPGKGWKKLKEFPAVSRE